MKTTVSPKYFVNYIFWKQFIASNSPQSPSNAIHLTILVTVRLFTHFKPDTRAIKLQKSAKICLTW